MGYRFAELYLDALEASLAAGGRPGLDIAFSAAASLPRCARAAGMNAHINFDLPQALLR